MCMGAGAYAAQVDQWEYNNKKQDLDWASNSNRWRNKLAWHEHAQDEATLAYSRQIGAIQQKIGAQRAKWLAQNESAFRMYSARRPGGSFKGDKATSFGRNAALAFYTDAGRRQTNLANSIAYGDVLQRQAGFQLTGRRNELYTKRGFAPIFGLRAPPPSRPQDSLGGMLEYGVNVAETAIGIATGVQGIGTAAGWSQNFKPDSFGWSFFGGKPLTGGASTGGPNL